MDIKKLNSIASLSWQGTRTNLDVLSIDGRIVFKGDSPNHTGDEYFVKIGDLETLEMVLNILNAVDCGGGV